ncbi:RecQ family ATP-dependent DNA helicase [Nocardioides sp. zg-536]|uniref:DNA 3'-5' helicase n=2 Tax=Nocardioides faecalis TaxID=2803858 RepID=A0A939BUP9_9ACTN|nr:DEAD/DEAH box helicase [Nocardioides faecalis]MBM9458727.1 RecQ family ATP-dependent DNA helicase [Nocardioides faecalis]MBS4753062.1 RecQ family ATP-dependent DNA helicase [Nocardioides faecalis]QVI58713.1 RecQ family ATP-dependent DNA helicase [Nocardioides faecalis]
MSTGPTVSSDVAAGRARAEQHLQALVGNPEARLYDDQWAAISALVHDRRRALVVQRTGWGKSAVYFVATLLLREQGAGPTVIISPLLALMRNQIAAAERAGIRAVTVNSTNLEQWDSAHAAIAAGEVDVLLVSPERLNNPGFRDEVLPRLAATCGLLVVDEAHCISDWGHDFRPDYRRIRTLLAELPTGIPVLATTATANQRVTDDVADQLVSPGGGLADVLVLRGTLDRASLRLGVVRLRTAEQRLAWLADHLAEQPGSGIVYCLTVAATQEVADYLRSRGHRVAAYSGQTEQTERLALEQALIDGEVKALIATSALGMGFDASLGFVVNLGAPSSPVAYYQQVGRAGRGTNLPPEGASVVLLPAPEDRDIWAYFSSLAFPREELVRETLAALAEHGGVMSTAALEPRVDLSRNRLETMLKVLDVDGAVRRVRGGWEATGREWSYDAERYARVAASRAAEQQAMLEYLDTDECRMRFLRRQLDDPEVLADPDWRCGRCDNCGGLTLSTEVSTAAVEEAADRLARPGVPIEPRKLWPTGLPAIGVELSGKIRQPAETGRAVARLTDLGHGAALRGLFAHDPASPTGVTDGPVPDGLARAMVAMLADWRPQVDVMVVAESERRPQLVADLAHGLSRYLGLPVVGRWAIADPGVGPDRGATNSAQRVAAVTRRCALRLDAPDAVRGARVLLVDDRVVTGWSNTLAAAALHDAGAAAVVPLVLGLSG